MHVHNLRRLAIASACATAIALSGGPTLAAITSRSDNLANPRGWSAVSGMDVQAVIDLAHRLPSVTSNEPDEPFCAPTGDLTDILHQDFDETLVSHGTQETSLWGSRAMGTWTLTLNRPDQTSCVVASGIGYSPNTNPMRFYHQAGMKG
ncbi:hypothetical protein [Paracoccus cavernae]|uniref:hypothetical protein n=1 Tax=Paracoccus cavernae TaxID=1571207 RepID=UPI00361B4359